MMEILDKRQHDLSDTELGTKMSIKAAPYLH